MTNDIKPDRTEELTAVQYDRNNYNHPINEDFRRFLKKLNWLERVLLFLSKTELFVLQYCTSATRMTLTSVGAMVAITGILAFSSSFFAVRNSFFRADKTLLAILVPLFIATIYACAIMAFDREIVSATDKRASVYRIPFAVIIGIVIAFPIELQLQHGRISAELKKFAEVRTKDLTAEINKLETSTETLLEEAVAPLKNKQKSLEKLRDQELKSMEWERQPEHGLCRGRCVEHQANAEKYQKELDGLKIQIEQERARVDNDKRALENKERINRLKDEKLEDENSSYDLLSQAVALNSIKKSPEHGWTAWTLGVFLMVFFVCFELFPVLIKMAMPYTEYHAYLDARMRLNVNKIIGGADHQLQFYRDNPQLIRLESTEITDMLAELVEDREVDIRGHKETRHDKK